MLVLLLNAEVVKYGRSEHGLMVEVGQICVFRRSHLIPRVLAHWWT